MPPSYVGPLLLGPYNTEDSYLVKGLGAPPAPSP